ncbi:cell division protein FtsK [Collinsella sp. An2]|nr:DNA translocase FtsK [Collinsella sp. An2]OUP07846.1 cell division protein FtsK [Collinsella sp. An2]
MTASAGRDIAGVVVAVFAVASFIAVLSPGTAPVTRALATFYHLGFGLGGYVLPLGLLVLSASLFLRDRSFIDVRTLAGVCVIFLSVISILVLALTPDPMVWGVTVGEYELAASGGYVGYAIASVLAGALGKTIAMVVLVGVLVMGFVLIGFSVGGVVRAAAERAERLAERRHVDVNERPWGDEAPAAPAARPAAAKVARGAQASLFDEDGTAETTFLGSRETTVLEDGQEEDEDPFVDLSEQLAAERAETTLIPPAVGRGARKGRRSRAAQSAVADKAPEPVADVSSDEAAVQEAPAATVSTATSNQSVDEDDLPPFDMPDTAASSNGSAAATDQPIPSFLLHPKSNGSAETAKTVVLPQPNEEASSKSDDGSATRVIDRAPARGIQPADGVTGEEEGRKLPPASMLRHNPNSASATSSNKELEQTAEGLQSTLQEFGLHSRVVGWIAGPTVTTFKVQPGEGERVSRITNLEDDIALSLATDSVRIFAPIPGTSLVGIEIPNRTRQTVAFGDILPYVTGGPLEFALGRDAEGQPMVADLAKMPHLLIAGTTGSGKSVVISSILMSLLMRTFPEDVRLIMIDPKRVEFAPYDGLPHLYVPVVTEPKQAASALQWAVSEMERRLKVFERIGVRKISTFNEKQAAGEFEKYDNPPAKMPYLVIVIDELSDLMMVAGKDVEASIVRIAQLGRAAGIHMIVATQRPSSNVVTGLIKANITNRIGLTVATGIDSRVILDQTGAEKLIGQGDMLFSRVDWGKPKRIQGCYVSDEEIFSVVAFVKEQSPAEYHTEILSAVSPAALGGGGGGHDSSDDDPLLWEAARIVVESQLGSTSGLQRRLKVGYARAGRIMDMLEEKGIVGPPDGSKPREVLLDEEGLQELESLEARMGEDDGMGGF